MKASAEQFAFFGEEKYFDLPDVGELYVTTVFA